MIKELEIDNFFMLNWLEQYLIGHKGFICGGCFKNIFNGEKVKDLDIFFRAEEDWISAVQYFSKNNEYKFYYENDKVKAYKHLKTGIVVELCRAIFGEPETIICNFDFTITKFAYYKEEVKDESTNEIHIEHKIICDDKFFEHLLLRRIVIDDKIPFPMSTFDRILRYSKYGYSPCRETKLKLAKAIKELPEQMIAVSESLYNGMD